MANLLQTGSTWLNQQREAHMSTTVTYCRGLATATMTATQAATETNVVDDSGVEVRGQVDDWIISVAEMILHDSPAYPQEGDEIRETNGNLEFVFAVTKGPDGKEWRYTDAYRQTMRIHTKRTAIN